MAIAETNTSDESVYAIIQEIASSIGTDPVELPPLSNAVDPDALTSLLHNPHSTELVVKFDYCEHNVTVDGAGNVEVTRQK